MGPEVREIILSKIKHQENPLYGLKWRPTLEPAISDDVDAWNLPQDCPPEFTVFDHTILKMLIKRIKKPRCIVEIGVDNSPLGFEHSSTNTILKTKPKKCIYLGIDILDRSHTHNVNNNVYTLKCSSGSHQLIKDKLADLKVSTIDFLFIDGWHSVNQVIEEWKYWDVMSPKSIMAFHDTNFHPGPLAVLDAVDETLFTVERFGVDLLDWGMACVTRK